MAIKRDMDFLKSKKIMGILNVSPDSFFDGGQYQQIDAALSQAQKMMGEGVHIIDIGGESTRPGSNPVSLEEEKRRVLPVLKEVHSAFPKLMLSVDTYKPEIARLSLEAGAHIINDIYGLRQSGMAEIAAEHDSYVVIMHMLGEPKSMQEKPLDKNAPMVVKEFLSRQVDFALKKGIKPDRIILDPGIGFGKTVAGNLMLIKSICDFKSMGFPVLIGASRKSVIGAILNNQVSERKNGSVVIHTLAWVYGADIIRVHDIKESLESLRIFEEFQSAGL